jgi:hypothetical protein
MLIIRILTEDMHHALACGQDRKAAAILLRIRALRAAL